MFSLKFKSLRIVDEKTIIISNTIAGEYIHVGSVSTKWKEHNTTWETFKTDSKNVIEAGFKYFIPVSSAWQRFFEALSSQIRQ
jgi:hypothetical protein